MKPRLRADWEVSIEVEELWIFDTCATRFSHIRYPCIICCSFRSLYMMTIIIIDWAPCVPRMPWYCCDRPSVRQELCICYVVALHQSSSTQQIWWYFESFHSANYELWLFRSAVDTGQPPSARWRSWNSTGGFVGTSCLFGFSRKHLVTPSRHFVFMYAIR